MPLVKSRDKSRKFVRCWFACDVILSPSYFTYIYIYTYIPK